MKKKIPFLLALSTISGHLVAQERPNILFVLVDDMQSSSIGALGNKDVSSPNIDAIIRNGTCFTNAYTNGSLGGALSMPSRAMIMTGKQLFQLKRDGQTIPNEHLTMPQILGSNGYKTFATGKWHNDIRSFNRSFQQGDNLFFGGMHPYERQGHTKPSLSHYDPTGAYKERFTGNEFSSKMYADAAIRFIEQSASESAPFFAYVAFTSPHDPRMQHPDYVRTIDPASISLPDNYLPEPRFDNGELAVRDEKIIATPRSADVTQKDLADYYMMIGEVDIQIGRIIEALRKSGKEQNTIIVFASDNGLAVGRHGLIGKQNLYDHSSGVPLSVVVPGAKSQTSEALCYLSDIAPTICELAGIDVSSAGMSGISLKPIIIGEEKRGERKSLLLAYSSIQRGVVEGNFKLILYNVNGKITKELFNLKKDPLEMKNLIGDPKYTDIESHMVALLGKKMEEEGDFCSLDDPTWWGKPQKITWNEALKIFEK